MNRRVTRGFYSRVPRWSTDTPEPYNWTLLKAWDFVPLAVVLIFVDPYSGLFFAAIAGASLWFCVRLGLRLTDRRRYCARHGHDPYRPVAEAGRWRCFRCDEVLEYPDLVRDADLGDEAPQARWSDRR